MKFTFCLSVLAGMYPGLSTLSYKAQVNIERRRADAGCGDGTKESQEKLSGAALGMPPQTLAKGSLVEDHRELGCRPLPSSTTGNA